MSVVADRLAAAGHTIPAVVPPLASYVPAVVSGSFVFTAGQVPLVGGQLPAKGKVGAEVTPERGYELAAICALNAIAAVGSLVDLDRVARVVKVVGYVACTPDFTGHPAVVNGASDLLAMAFGDAGMHARSAVGVASLPLDAPVEVELVVELA